ncbi:MAG: hypothetical protein ABIH65_03495 [Nanoarchaeota archaeon]
MVEVIAITQIDYRNLFTLILAVIAFIVFFVKIGNKDKKFFEQKYWILPIISFVLAIIQGLLYFRAYSFFWIGTILAISCSIFTLTKIKNQKNIKGKILTWLAIGLCILILILYLTTIRTIL